MFAEIYFLYVVIDICDMLIVFILRNGEQQKSVPCLFAFIWCAQYISKEIIRACKVRVPDAHFELFMNIIVIFCSENL